MEIPRGMNIGPLPPLLANPAAIEGVVKKKIRTEESERARLRYIEPFSLPIHVQLGRKHLNALREEIGAAENVLINVYEDISMFDARQAALNDITHLLFTMQQGLDVLQLKPAKKDEIKNEILNLIELMGQVVDETRHRSLPLLAPVTRIAPFPEKGKKMNEADIVFLIDRNRWMKKDVKHLSQCSTILYDGLVNRGIEPRLGVQPFERNSQPAGPMRTDVQDFMDDLGVIYFDGETRNALTAVSQALSEQSFRPEAQRMIVVFSDGAPHDDYGSYRTEITEALEQAGASLFYIGVNETFSGAPFGAYAEICRATGGRCLNFAGNTMDSVMEELAAGITELMIRRGAKVYDVEERTVQVGPPSSDAVTTRFPDFRLETLGLKDLPLDSEQDYRTALDKINAALDLAVRDRAEKAMLQDYLERIITVFDDIRLYRLDFKV